MGSDRRDIRCLYRIIIPLECGETIHLGKDYLAAAISLAKRLSEDDWWEVVDSRTGNIVAGSMTHGKKD